MARPRKPTKLHLLRGTFRPGRHGDRLLEPQPAAGAKPPTWLTKRGRLLWDELAQVLERNGMLTEVDGYALANCCNAQAEIVRSRRRGLQPPIMLEKLVQSYLIQFGMTPSSRSRVKSTTAATQSKLERFTSGRK